VTVKKANGFRAPYRSDTFQDIVDAQMQRKGLLSMDGAVTEGGGTVTVPPFAFVQNGLLVNKDVSTAILLPSNIVAPYFLTVTSTNPQDTDNLSFQFAKSPQDVTSTEVIVAEFDGNEWREQPFLSIDALIKGREQQNVDSDLVGAREGLLTTVNGGNYDNSPGQLVEKGGRSVRLEDIFATPIIADDPDWPRVDRMIYRRARDSEDRIGHRKLVVGGTYDPTSTLYDTQLLPGSGDPTQKTKVLIYCIFL